eukprot:Gb_41771 [translate_table: standard]
MGIPKEIAKIGVRRGMWRHVKKIDHGVHSYRMARISGSPISRSAFMATINTKVPIDYFRSLGLFSSDTEELVQDSSTPKQGNVWRWLIIGGVVVLACGLNRRVVNKALIGGVARRLQNFGKKI